MDNKTIAEIVNQLDEAERNAVQMRLISQQFPDMTIDDAYSIQKAWIEKKINEGARAIGRKVGLTSKATQTAINTTEPAYGVLLNHMQFEESTDIIYSRFIDPKIEVELAFILEKPLKGSNCCVIDVLEATKYIIPALEIVDSRINPIDIESNAPKKVLDTISDNTSSAGIILGGRPISPKDLDLSRVQGILYRNSVIEETGVSAAVLNNPAKSIAWLANKLALSNTILNAGEIILSGAFTRPLKINQGDVFHIDYGSLGQIACHFV